MKTLPNTLRLIARSICVLAILFVSLFATDAFNEGGSMGQILLHFVLHLIPSFILCACLLLAWKNELWGGILLALIGAGFMPFIYYHNFQMNHNVLMSLGILLCIPFPFFLAGILFIGSWYGRKNKV